MSLHFSGAGLAVLIKRKRDKGRKGRHVGLERPAVGRDRLEEPFPDIVPPGFDAGVPQLSCLPEYSNL